MKIEFTKEWCLRMAELEAHTASDHDDAERVPPALAVRIDAPTAGLS